MYFCGSESCFVIRLLICQNSLQNENNKIHNGAKVVSKLNGLARFPSFPFLLARPASKSCLIRVLICQNSLAIQTTVHNGAKVISKLNGLVRFSRPLLPSLFCWRELLLWYHELSWVDLVLGFFHKWRHYFLVGKELAIVKKIDDTKE